LKNGSNFYRPDFVTFNIHLLPSIWHIYFMFTPIGALLLRRSRHPIDCQRQKCILVL